MTNPPLVSVLMTCYNTGATIATSIESVLSQTYTNWELIILDDVSRDNTRDVIDSFQDARIRRIYNTENIGYVASKNVLLQEMKGAFGCFLDADDWMREDRIQEQLRFLLENPDVGACMCAYIRVQPDGSTQLSNFFDESKFLSVKKGEIHFAGAGIMFSRRVVSEIGGFEPYFNRLMGDDTYWAVKIAEKFKFYYLNSALYYYMSNESSITSNFENIRKLTILDLLHELKRQRLEKGTDWLEEKQYEKALAYEMSLTTNKTWLSERFRHAAAIRLDFNDFTAARQFLKKAFLNNPLNFRFYKTLVYYYKVRTKLSHSK